MTPEEVGKLPDYGHEINRTRLRHCGVGPRLHDDQPNKLWPRDILDPEDECRKLLYPELRKLIGCSEKIKRTEAIIFRTFKALKQCNVNNLFNKYCHLDHGYFDRYPFNVINSLETYTSYDKVLAFVHQVIRSINMGRGRSTMGDHVKLLFGSNRNFDIYKRHLSWLIKGNSRMNSMVIGRFVSFQSSSMNISKIYWLQGLPMKVKYRIFIQIISALTRFLAELLRRYFYITTSNPYSNKVFYYRYDLWRKLQAVVVQDYLRNGTLRLDSSILDAQVVEDSSRMKFLLKKDNVRLICTGQNRKIRRSHYEFHAVLSYVLENMPFSNQFKLNDLLEGLLEMRRQSLSCKKQIYFVRADIENCFNSVRQDKLRQIIKDFLASRLGPDQMIEIHKVRCTLKGSHRLRSPSAREIFRWTMDIDSFKRRTKFENVHELGSKVIISIDEFDEIYLRPQLIEPIIRESKQSKSIYRLQSGIRQGSKSSPLLCSIYIREALNSYLHELVVAPDCRIFHYVDDFLFMTTDLSKAKQFLIRMLDGFDDFNLRSNINKLACNFEFESPNLEQQVPKLDQFVLFYKRKISLDTLQCNYHFSYQNVSIDNTFHVSPYFDQNHIYRQVSRLINIENIHLDSQLNGAEQVMVNIFESALLVAHRVGTLLIVSFEYRNLENQQPILLLTVVSKISRRIYQHSCSNTENNLIRNPFLYHEMRLIVLAAFLATWSQAKLRHRTKELDELEREFRKSMMINVVIVQDYEGRDNMGGKPFEAKLLGLIREFPKSNFAQEVQLPNKN